MTQQEKIIQIIEKMEQNTFLLPDSWSDQIQLAKEDMSYRTYVGRRGADRYISIEIFKNQDKLDLTIRGTDIQTQQSIFKKQISVDEVMRLIEAIYTEKHSFIENAEGIKKLRVKIQENRKLIKRIEEENKKLEQQIVDALKVKGE